MKKLYVLVCISLCFSLTAICLSLCSQHVKGEHSRQKDVCQAKLRQSLQQLDYSIPIYIPEDPMQKSRISSYIDLDVSFLSGKSGKEYFLDGWTFSAKADGDEYISYILSPDGTHLYLKGLKKGTAKLHIENKRNTKCSFNAMIVVDDLDKFYKKY